jgi:capsule polysaccharide export protein KpsE/RkpR
MITIPMPWSSKMNKANISSFKIKNESLDWQNDLNEATGMISGMQAELTNKKAI